MTEVPHRRYNPLADKWVLVSPQRMLRPWQGEEHGSDPAHASYDPDCYLCPGNVRATGVQNPEYEGAYIFPNDYPAMLDNAGQTSASSGLLRSESVRGMSEVLCFSADHNKSLPQLDIGQVKQVVDTWCDETARLGQDYTHVQIFENKGAIMGCSNPHPHGQIWASDHIPDEVRIEDRMQAKYFTESAQNLLSELVDAEIANGDRVVVQNDLWLAIVPYWASWPFETLLLPRFPAARLSDLGEPEKVELARAVRELTIRYDNLFQCSFPYSMGWHGAPFDGSDTGHWLLHAHFYPPLLRSASIRKFMVGYEMLAEAQRDLTPERAAEMLRTQPIERYQS